jgi:hypothetical protein
MAVPLSPLPASTEEFLAINALATLTTCRPNRSQIALRRFRRLLTGSATAGRAIPPADPRDALIRGQAARIAALEAEIAGQAERIAALEAAVADLREQLAAAERAGSRNSGNSSMPPSADDLPGRKPPGRQRRAAGRAEGKKRRRGKQPGSPGAAMRWEEPDRTEWTIRSRICTASAWKPGTSRSCGCRKPMPPGDIRESRLRRDRAAGPGTDPVP